MTIRRHLAAALVLAFALGVLGTPEAAAQSDRRDAASDVESAEARRQARAAELEALRRSIEVSERRQSDLQAEIAALTQDQAGLNAELIATAERLRETEDEIAANEARLDELRINEERIRASLYAQRDVMAEVLMALQRMGRTPPPALLSRPQDALAAIRGSIVAGAVLPDIRIQAESLAADLSELTQLMARIEAERDSLRISYLELEEEQARIDLLVEAKKAQRSQTEAALLEEQAKIAELADQAVSLQGLIERLETEVAAAAEAAEEARRAAAATERASRDEAARLLADTSRIAPAVRFVDAMGLLSWPVAGDAILRYGEPDGLGGESQGLSISTRPGTTVLAPADGWVVYAGPFRSYGQVLIVNAGDGFHIVLAGMERIDVVLGQFVLSGEPIAGMGSTRLASIGDMEHTSAQAILYVEFRKDGEAIDSAPWWASTDGEVNG